MSHGQLTEEKILRMIQENLQGRFDRDEVPIGDDAALISCAPKTLVTTDLLIEDVHFIRNQISAFDLGYKSLAVNLSDIAAMGGEPQSVFLSIALPGNLSESWLRDWIEGFRFLASQHDVRVAGGDTTGSPGPIVINVLLTGKPSARGPLLRSTAKAGDLLYVSGNLGDSKAGLAFLLKPGLEKIPPAIRESLLQKHHRPYPYVKQGQWLARRNEVTAMMDVSDGLWKDLGRLAQASQVGFEVPLEELPISDDLREFGQILNKDVKPIALAGGEDYVLLWAVDPKTSSNFEQDYQKEFGQPPHRIGSLTQFANGQRFLLEGKEYRGPLDIFEHF